MRNIIFNENILRKILGFDCIHENKTLLFFFFREEINLKIFRFFLDLQIFFEKCFGEN